MSAEIRRRLRGRLHYTDPVSSLYQLALDGDEHELWIIGDPDNGAYEWVIRRDDQLEHSDAAYGQPAIALRVGLIEYFGLPDSVKTPPA